METESVGSLQVYPSSNGHRSKIYLIAPVFNNKAYGLIAYFPFNS